MRVCEFTPPGRGEQRGWDHETQTQTHPETGGEAWELSSPFSLWNILEGRPTLPERQADGDFGDES